LIPSVILNFLKTFLAHPALGANPIIRDIFKQRPGFDAVIRIPFGRIINVIANLLATNYGIRLL
jgi:hypothetical protein